VRAIEHGLKLARTACADGLRRLNDGMNLVGDEGKGESVWLAFFLYDVLRQFGRLAENRQTPVRRALPRGGGKAPAEHRTAGLGRRWYRRAYFDDGTPLGRDE